MALCRSTKIIVSITAVILIVFFTVAGFAAWKIYSIVSFASKYAIDKKIPSELSEPRVLTGNGFVTKKVLLKKSVEAYSQIVLKGAGKSEDERERFTSIEVAKSIYGFSDIHMCGKDVVAAGKFGAYVFDLDGNVKRFISFEPVVEEVKILFWKKKHLRETTAELGIFDVEGDGKCEFHSHDAGDGFTLFDSEGRVRWRYRHLTTQEYLSKDEDEPRHWVTDVGTFDLNDDGKQDLILNVNEEGLRAFTADQKELWFRPGDISSETFQLIDIDADGTEDLVNVIGEGSEVIDKGSGKLIRKLPLPGGSSGLLTVNQPKPQVVSVELSDKKFEVKDLTGETVISVDAPLSELADPSASNDYPYNIYEPAIRAVSLRSGDDRYFVVLGSYISIPRSELYIYNATGKLVYQEILPEETEVMTVVDAADGKQDFLVAGKDTVWRYSAN